MHRNLTPEKTFRTCWSLSLRLSPLLSDTAKIRNYMLYPWKDMIFLRLLQEMERADLRYRPKLKIKNRELLNPHNKEQPFVVVTVHSPVDAILNRVFEEHSIDWTILAASAGASEKSRLLGLESELDWLTPSSDSLLLLRRKLKEGKLVCADIDYAQRREGTRKRDLVMSPILFQLAKNTNSQVVYAYTRVMDEGYIEASFGNPSIDMTNASASDFALDFITWLRNQQNDRREWMLNNRATTSKVQRKKIQLTDLFCGRMN